MHVTSILAAAGAVAAVGMAATGVAGAYTAAAPGIVGAHGMTPAAVGHGTSSTFEAGYAASTPTSASLSVTVTVPTLKCLADDNQPDFVTLGLYGDDANDNFDESGGGLLLSCQSGESVFNITDNGLVNMTPVSPGDQVQVSVSVSPSGETESYVDLTSGATSTVDTGTGYSVNGSQTTMQGAYANAASRSGFPKFSPTRFTGVTVDGSALGTLDPTQYYQVGPTGKKQIVSSAIKQQSNFTDTWVTG